MIDAVLFDNWNTLVQAPELMRPGASVESFHRSIKSLGFELDKDRFTEAYREIARAQAKESESCGWKEHDYLGRISLTLQRLDVPDETRTALAAGAWRSYLDDWLRLTTFYPETPSVLDSLRGKYRLGMVTNFMDGPVCRLVFDKFGYEQIFRSLIVSAEEGYLKPSPRLFEKALAELGSAAAGSVMVGDTYDADIVGAHNAGMRGVLIDPEGKSREHHGDCDAVVKSIGEVPSAIRGLY